MEILAGNMDGYFKRSGIVAVKTWEGEFGEELNYQVWDITRSEFEKLLKTDDETYKSDEWWRSSNGSNMGLATEEYIINGKNIKAWDGALRKEYDNSEVWSREYENLLDYFEGEHGCTEPRNIVALAVDLAAQNGITMAKLLALYEGGNLLRQEEKHD